MIRKLFAAWLTIFSLAAFSAQFQVTESRFRFHPAENGFSQFDLLRWKPTNSYSTGITVNFHGDVDSGTYCQVSQHCVTSSCFQYNSANWNSDTLTGLENSDYWTPKCPQSVKMGNSLAAISTTSSNGYRGIGIYTYTGEKPNGIGNAFFQPKHINPNNNIEGTYVHFSVSDAGSMRPFSAECDWMNDPTCEDNVRLRVWTNQLVDRSYTPPGTQSLQKVAFVLENDSNTIGSAFARIEYTPFVFCGGDNCVNRTNAVIRFDPNQGGAPFVGGPLLGGGNPTQSQGVTVWESYGPSYATSPFDTTWFHYEISWGDFVSTLRYVTSQTGQYNGNSDSDVAQIFGTNWNDPHSWRLKNFRYAQEVFNPDWDNGVKAYVGGHSNWMQMDAIKK